MRPPTASAGGKEEERKESCGNYGKVPVPDVVPVVDSFNTIVENMENSDNSVQSVGDWSGHAVQQQAWGWLSTNLKIMMNQRKGNVRNDRRQACEIPEDPGKSRVKRLVASPSGFCSAELQ